MQLLTGIFIGALKFGVRTVHASTSAVYDAFRFDGQFVSCQKYFIFVTSTSQPERKDV